MADSEGESNGRALRFDFDHRDAPAITAWITRPRTSLEYGVAISMSFRHHRCPRDSLNSAPFVNPPRFSAIGNRSKGTDLLPEVSS